MAHQEHTILLKGLAKMPKILLSILKVEDGVEIKTLVQHFKIVIKEVFLI
jgi:hypothetical protein